MKKNVAMFEKKKNGVIENPFLVELCKKWKLIYKLNIEKDERIWNRKKKVFSFLSLFSFFISEFHVLVF